LTFAILFAALALLIPHQTVLAPISASTSDSPALDDATARAAERLTPAGAPTGRLIVSAENGGAWNIFAVDPNNGAWQRIALNATPARDPAISPDGKTIAFRSKRDGVWEIYAARGDAVTRLTRGMIYSGAPVWSPDGKKIAFESHARGDLDIWTMNADGTQAIDLTDSEKAHDYAPAWSPDGKWIAFTSWRTGTQQIFVVSADCERACKPLNISQNKFGDQKPAWSPDGKSIAFVSDRDGQRAIYVAEFSIGGLKNARRVTFSGWDDQPTWSLDGKWLAFISARPTRQPIYIVPADGGIPRIVENGPAYASSIAWAPDSIIAAENNAGETSAPLYKEQPDLAPAGSDHPYELRRIRSARLEGGLSRLSSRIADSFGALQERVKKEVGYDFLAVMSDMLRPIDIKCDITCDTLSWHKAGRAVDTRLDYADARGNALEIVREDMLGETYWRVYLRAAAQDGTLGEPMKEPPWDLSYRARWIVGRGEGGTTKPLPAGFYVDFTELARQYGWERISAHDSEEFDWKTNKIGAEYWHFQKTHGLNWYQAMREVYSESEIKAIAEWNALASQSGYDAYLLYLKGIPAPAEAWRWFVLGP
jgi:TolB protein